MPEEELKALFVLCEQHKLTAAAYDYIAGTSGAEQFKAAWKRRTQLLAAAQLRRESALLEICGSLEREGIPYAVLKGAVCRALYDRGERRISADEDIYTDAAHLEKAKALLLSMGAVPKGGGGRVFSFILPASGLYVELHASPEENASGVFEGALLRRVSVQVLLGRLYTLSPADNLLFMTLHAKKHFAAGGFGLRTLADIAVFMCANKSSIDWNVFENKLAITNSKRFFAVLQRAVVQYLGFSREETGCPACLYSGEDVSDLFEDILDAGIYGSSTRGRLHSFSAARAACGGKSGAIAAAFPGLETMRQRYPYLKCCPALLPAAWLSRACSYFAEVLSKKYPYNTPLKSLRLAKHRSELMKKYGITVEKGESIARDRR